MFILLVLSCSSENKQRNDLKEKDLNGKVKSIRSYTYRADEKFGEIIKGELIDYLDDSKKHYFFNELIYSEGVFPK